jgi:hypothetical protein
MAESPIFLEVFRAIVENESTGASVIDPHEGGETGRLDESRDREP